MNGLINRHATPLITGLFLVSAISGIALFFHWQPGAFHGMHEWLSMVLLVPFVLHVWKNWKPLCGYARGRALPLALAVSVLAAVPFALAGFTGGSGGNPGFRAISVMTQARVADLAPVLGTTPDALLSALNDRGYPARSPDDTLDRVAEAAGRPASEALIAVLPRR